MTRKTRNQRRPADTDQIKDLVQESEEKVREFFRSRECDDRVATKVRPAKPKKTAAPPANS